ncbi:MAG: glycosyltransferase [Pseudomonadota bacterium]
MISVICVYNSREVFNKHLLKSLENQSAAFDLIALDNTSSTYSSAARALNYGARQIKAECTHLMFAHQDISLRSADWLKNIEPMLYSLHNLGIAGAAGMAEHDARGLSNIMHGSLKKSAGFRIEKPTEVMTVDECLAIIPRTIFEKYQFDEIVCDGWHAYMVEYCLRIKAAGLGLYVLPVELYHGSTGTLNAAYFRALNKVLKKHRGAHAKIHTACGVWDTRTPVMVQWGLRLIKKLFYGFTGRLIAAGLVPEWLQQKKRKRIQSGR